MGCNGAICSTIVGYFHGYGYDAGAIQRGLARKFLNKTGRVDML